MDSRLNEPGEMIDAIQAWINEVRVNQSAASEATSVGTEILLREVVELIHPSTPLFVFGIGILRDVCRFGATGSASDRQA